ncbi:hypothetical protein EG68_05862 [Paragonimus skrjabini miyazakii]|uniref:Methyl methanesulfonate-sensitivity protein 22-like n=1 Tax=Paragonimus skrjabini miyazakii TaxID=59628 RepID=A0A8S9YPP5_9TREM|nr:hypothetical protein EG68_05862 [Paragonimus skrjabini miyazakii]
MWEVAKKTVRTLCGRSLISSPSYARTQRFQAGWFKYLHGKLLKLSSSRKADVYKPCSLEGLRPNPVLHTDGQCSADAKNQALWSLYWALLAHTAPLHRDYIVFRLHGDVSPEQIQKYSIVVWLIRKLFLGELVPSEKDTRFTMDCLLRVVDIWGPNMETVRSLWLYFGRQLDHGVMPSHESGSSVTSSVDLFKFEYWLSQIQGTTSSELTSFELFCLLLRKVPHQDLGELRTILKLSLPSLTRHVLPHYFLLLGHLFDAYFEQWESNKQADGYTKAYDNLVEVLLCSCPNMTSTTELQNWDAGRRCSTLQGVQYLLLLCMHYFTKLWNSDSCLDNTIVERGFYKLADLTNSIRASLSSSLASGSSRLSSVGWRSDWVAMSIQFGLDMLGLMHNASETLLRWISRCFDSSFLQSLRWSSSHQCWNLFITQMLISLRRFPSDSKSAKNLICSMWSDVYPHFKQRVQRKTNQSSPLTDRAARELATVALEFVNLSYIDCTVQTIISVAKPLDLFEFFTFDQTVDYAVRFAVLEICFTSPGALENLIASSIVSSVDDAVTIGWRFLTCWLAYCLLVKPCMEEREQNHLNSYERLTVIGSQFSIHFPSEVANLVTESDVELTLINIAARFDELTAFHERMAYKMLASTHLSRLCLLLCDCCSVSSLAKDIHTGRDFCRLPDLTVDSLNFIGFRAVSLLIRHCAQLLHAPVTGSGALSAMEQLIDNFVLPRQLYDWERLCRHASSISVEQPLAKSVMECLCDKLTEFTSGLAQLAWRSDAYIARILRDIIRLYYAHLGSECIAVSSLSDVRFLIALV